ncbi:unnamed protein product, partial [Symbiodinium microadriaticum]
LHLCFESDTREYILWRDGIVMLLKQFNAIQLDTQRRVEEAISAAIKRGRLQVSLRPGGDKAEEMVVVLTAAELLVLIKNKA